MHGTAYSLCIRNITPSDVGSEEGGSGNHPKRKSPCHCQTSSFPLQRGVYSQALARNFGIYIRSPAIAEVEVCCVVHSGFACQSLHYYVVVVFEERGRVGTSILGIFSQKSSSHSHHAIR